MRNLKNIKGNIKLHIVLFIIAMCVISIGCCAMESSFSDDVDIPFGKYAIKFDTEYVEEHNGGWISHNSSSNIFKYNLYQTFMGVGTQQSSTFNQSTRSFPSVCATVDNHYLKEGNVINMTRSYYGAFEISSSCRELINESVNNQSTFVFKVGTPIEIKAFTYERKISDNELQNLGYNCKSAFQYNYDGARIKCSFKSVLTVTPNRILMYAFDSDWQYKLNSNSSVTMNLPSEDEVYFEMTPGFPERIYKPQFTVTHNEQKSSFKSLTAFMLYGDDYFAPFLSFDGYDLFSEEKFKQMIVDGNKIYINVDESVVCEKSEGSITLEPVLSAPGIDVEVVEPKCAGDKGKLIVKLSKEVASSDNINLIVKKDNALNGEKPICDTTNVSTVTVFNDILPDTYTVKVSGGWTDTNGNFHEYYAGAPRHRAVVTMPAASPALEIANVGKSDITCFGAKDGSVSYSVLNAKGGYTATLQSAKGEYKNRQSNAVQFSGLDAGSYTLSVIDGNGCQAQYGKTIEIFENEPLEFSVSGADATSYGKSDGKLNIEFIKGGEPPYTLSWQSADGSVTGEVSIPSEVKTKYCATSRLLAGHYTVLVTDSNGCAETSEADIYQPLSLTVDTRNVKCHGYADGKLRVKVNGGMPPYIVDITSNENFKREVLNVDGGEVEVSGLVAGEYKIEVKDGRKEGVSEEVTIKEPEALDVSLPSELALCNGQTARIGVDATINANSYEWYKDGEPIGDGDSIEVAQAGVYTVEVQSGECSGSASTIVRNIPKDVSCEWIVASQASKNGPVRLVNITRENYTSYRWHYPENAGIEIEDEGERYIDLKFGTAGIYVLGMSSYNDECVSTVYKSIEVVEEQKLDGDYDASRLSIKRFAVSPNPSDGNITISLELSKKADADIQIFDMVKGKRVASAIRFRNSSKYYEQMSLSLNAGVYSLILTIPENNIRQTFKLIIR